MRKKHLTSGTIREKTIAFACKTGAGHLAPSLSCVEILTILFRDILIFDTQNPTWTGRDRLVFSKGHGAYAYYIIQYELGLLPKEELDNFGKSSTIEGCLTKNEKYMIEASTGSLGHGFPIAVGMAKAFKMQNMSNRVICIVGDGEMQEGSNFEALALAHRFKLDNLLLIVDANGLQAMNKVNEVCLDNDTLSKVLSCYVKKENFFDMDGHNETLLLQNFRAALKQKNGCFSICFCRTIKGKGLPMIENVTKYHYRCPTEDGYVCKYKY